MSEAKDAHVLLVADNLQSTGSAGKTLADELGATHVTLSNFPGGYPEEATWESATEGNLRRLVQALGER